jgi:hypothetical protein
MHSYDHSVRFRYWCETTLSRLKSLPWLPLVILFLVAAQAISRSSADGSFFVFALAVVFGVLYMRSLKSTGPPGRDRAPILPPQSAVCDPEMERLLTALERLEKRLVNLEAMVTQKEFDWERRLNEKPPVSPTT